MLREELAIGHPEVDNISTSKSKGASNLIVGNDTNDTDKEEEKGGRGKKVRMHFTWSPFPPIFV